MANLFEPPRYIAVEGPIRVGKSTLCQVIAETLHAQRITEPERNPFLRPFYDGERGAAFQAQFAFLIARYEQLGSLDVKRNPNKTYVAELHFRKGQTVPLPQSGRCGAEGLQPLLRAVPAKRAHARSGHLSASHARGAEEAAEEKERPRRKGHQRRLPGRGDQGLRTLFLSLYFVGPADREHLGDRLRGAQRRLAGAATAGQRAHPRHPVLPAAGSG